MNDMIAAFETKLAAYAPEERALIMRAAAHAFDLHRDQLRASGEPYIVHPLGVAEILIGMKMDAESVAASLLHDSIEDTSATSASLESLFGPGVALMVDGVTKIADLSAKNKTLQEAESIRKMLFAMVKDIRVILIKLADKLNNMRTLTFLAPDRQKSIAQECLDIYAPLADRLGISWMKDELEDLSLKHLNRDVYDQIKRIVALKKGERAIFLERVQSAIVAEAASSGIEISVTSRAKHFYSIYQKMRKRGKGAEDLYDLLGIRILCAEEDDCYTLLGIVHRLWKPIDGRFKDYVAMPKANGYRSLHTTVMGYDGMLIEIQIRTWEMHRIAEFGVASHWIYKKGSTKEVVRLEDLSIVNRLKNWNDLEREEGRDMTSSGFLEDIKRELLKDSIYVFTPKGNVVELPAGSTPIDFAYHIHSAIGDHCVASKADGVIVPLTAELRNTQVVEILTSPSAHPHVNWLRAARTAKARSRIRAWLLANDDTLIIDRNVVAKKKAATPPPPLPAKDDEPIQTVLHGQVTPGGALQVTVESERNMMIRFAQCCRPVTGDPIIGYVSRGRGIIVHRRNCRNVASIPDFADRKIEVEWENTSSRVIKRFRVEARRSSDLFSEIEGAVRKFQGHLLEGKLEENSSNRLTGYFTMELEDKEDAKKVLKSLRGIPSVVAIQPMP